MPIEKQVILSVMPAAFNSSCDSKLCVMDAGWVIVDVTPPKLTLQL